ncbi:hypothetical protein CYMTET_43946, partial [Cymbomonas tetramitiformis]
TFLDCGQQRQAQRTQQVIEALQQAVDSRASQQLQPPSVGKAATMRRQMSGIAVSSLAKVDWLNGVLKALWPHLNVATCNTVVSCLQPLLDANTTSFLTSIRFEEFDLGPTPPCFNAVRAVHLRGANNVELDADVEFIGQPNIVLEIKMRGIPSVFKVRLNAFMVSGCLRLRLDQLLSQWPLFSSFTLAFCQKPHIAFNLKAMQMEIMSLPILSDNLEDLVEGLIMKYFTVPNYVWALDYRSQPTDDGVDSDQVDSARGGEPL